jgi:hypothetical protein
MRDGNMDPVDIPDDQMADLVTYLGTLK